MPKITPEFIERMEDVLELYHKPYTPDEAVLCFDEKSKQLLEDTRPATPTQEGKTRRRDYEYKRNGTQNIFLTVEPKAGFRTASVTKQRKKSDFAHEIERIINLSRYRNTEKIHFVLDNLNTHFESSFIQTFGKQKTENILKRIVFHHTPKHASWLNMAEIEIGIMDRQCTKRRIPNEEQLIREIGAWKERRNDCKAKINWKFTTKDARRVFKYPRQI